MGQIQSAVFDLFRLKRITLQNLFDLLITSWERVVVPCRKGENVRNISSKFARRNWSGGGVEFLLSERTPLIDRENHDGNISSCVTLLNVNAKYIRIHRQPH